MIEQDNLKPGILRLKSGNAWSQNREALAIVLVRTGGGRAVCGGAQRKLEAGDVLLVNGIGPAKIEANGSALETWGFSVGMEQLYPLLGLQEITQLQRTAEKLRGGKVYPASSPIAMECNSIADHATHQKGIRQRSELLRLAATVIAEELQAARRAPGFGNMDEHVAKVLEGLTHDDFFMLSVDELSAKFSCTRRHLNRIFQHCFGASVGTIRMEMRLLKAISALRDRKTKVIDVAEACGFSHLSLFNTCFKKRFGITPGEWRKRHIASTQEEAQPDEMCPLRRSGLCAWESKGPSNNRTCSESRPQAVRSLKHAGSAVQYSPDEISLSAPVADPDSVYAQQAV